MRASSRAVALAATLALVSRDDASAHRREDYLQAARIGVEPDRLEITLDLTPGVAVAESFLAALDRDHDGAVSAGDQRGYAERVTRALALEVDGRLLTPRAVSWAFPEPSSIRAGHGTIRLEIAAALPVSAEGAHRVRFRNTHLEGHSAYLANALVPGSSRVAVKAQRRSTDQAELTIDYHLSR